MRARLSDGALVSRSRAASCVRASIVSSCATACRDLLRAVGDLPALAHAGLHALADLREPVAERAGLGRLHRAVEARLGLQRRPHEPSPRLSQRERVDVLALGRTRDGERDTARPRERSHSGSRHAAGGPATIAAAAPPPASRIAPGEVMARATGGVKNRSRKRSATIRSWTPRR